MKDVEILEIVGIPYPTISRWKLSKDWRKVLYSGLARLSKKQAATIFYDLGDIKKTASDILDVLVDEYKGESKELYKDGALLTLNVCDAETANKMHQKATHFAASCAAAIAKEDYLGVPANKFYILGSLDASIAILNLLDKYYFLEDSAG